MSLRPILLSVLLSSASLSVSLAQEFPLTIAHKFGESVLEKQPARVVSIDFGGIDNLLAVGVEPLAVRQWRAHDGFAYTAGPWTEGLLTTQPVVLEGALDFEAIAALEPDVIIGVYSGINEADYEKLSLIAPVVAVPENVGDYALEWDERARIAARAVGKQAEAEERIAAIRNRVDEIRVAHPQWAELTAVVGGIEAGAPWAYTNYDVRGQFLEAFGFQVPEALAAINDPNTFYVEGSPEDIGLIDADVTVWYGSTELENVPNSPVYPFLRSPPKGGEIYLPDSVVAAFARVSLLSLPVVLDAMVPMLEAAADGDPATPVEGDLQ